MIVAMSELYAHAVIETADGTRINRGDVVPADLEGVEDLQAGGSVRSDEYVEQPLEVQPPNEIVIDGVTYKKASDGAVTGDERA